MSTTNASEMRLARKLADAALAAPPVAGPTNEEFAAMTAAQKRVAIAKDVLQWVEAGKALPCRLIYFRVFEGPAAPTEDSTWGGPAYARALRARELVSVGDRSCHVCALGAVWATACERTDINIGAVAAADGTLGENMREALGGLFESDQLARIECAFEQSDAFGGCEPEDAARAAAFGRAVAKACVPEPRLAKESFHTWEWRCERASDRRVMRAIMQNIIDNDGTFIP